MNVNSSNVFTAVAVCGCGHDGRLGIVMAENDYHNKSVMSKNNLYKSNRSLVAPVNFLSSSASSASCPELVEQITLIPEFTTPVSSIRKCNESIENSNSSKDNCEDVELSITVKSIHVGGYHNIVCTSQGELYGWGLNENGELGLGQCHSKNVTTNSNNTHSNKHNRYFARPTLLSFFNEERCKDLVANNQNEVIVEMAKSRSKCIDSSSCILDVACGAHHSLVLTRCGLYATGCNEYGQLGLGHTNNVYEWTCVLPRILSKVDQVHLRCSNPKKDKEWKDSVCRNVCTSNVANSSQIDKRESIEEEEYEEEQFDAIILHAEITHISAGTHHSLLALRDVVVCESAESENMNQHSYYNREKYNLNTLCTPSENELQRLRNGDSSCNYECYCYYYPTLLLACGKGDFGELGYDGNLWSTLQSKAARLQTQLSSESNVSRFIDTTISTNTNTVDPDCYDNNDATNTYSSVKQETILHNFKSKWKPKVERRPEFFNTSFQAVQFPLLLSIKHRITREMVCKFCNNEDESKIKWSELVEELRYNITNVSSYWDVVQLQAMHLHSAVILEKRGCNAAVREADKCNQAMSDNKICKTFHWGCYYCGAIEDVHSSLLQEINISSSNGHHQYYCDITGIHAGNEILFRYYKQITTSKVQQCVKESKELSVLDLLIRESMVEVRGSGNLGNGKEDCVQVDWAVIALPECNINDNDNNIKVNEDHHIISNNYIIKNIVGKDHFLINTIGVAAKENECKETSNQITNDIVFGFGDNLHGQLGQSLAKHELLCNSCNSHLIGSNRSNLISDNNNNDDNDNDYENEKMEVVYTPRIVLATGDIISTPGILLTENEKQQVQQQEQQCVKAEQYVVRSICDVGAGARHSVFLLKVQKVDFGQH